MTSYSTMKITTNVYWIYVTHAELSKNDGLSKDKVWSLTVRGAVTLVSLLAVVWASSRKQRDKWRCFNMTPLQSALSSLWTLLSSILFNTNYMDLSKPICLLVSGEWNIRTDKGQTLIAVFTNILSPSIFISSQLWNFKYVTNVGVTAFAKAALTSLKVGIQERY